MSQDQLVVKKVTGYKNKLNREEILHIAKMACEGAFYPELARAYGITICECEGLLKTEQVGKQNIRYKIYGTKVISWKDPNTKVELQKLIAEGYDDDMIAELWSSTLKAVARGRSTLGLVAFNRIVANGHHSPPECTHGVEGEWTKQPDPCLVKEVSVEQTGFATSLDEINKALKAREVHGYSEPVSSGTLLKVESLGNSTGVVEIRESNGKQERTATISNGGHTNLYPIKKIDVSNHKQPAPASSQNILFIFHDAEKIKPGIANALTKLIDWRNVAARIQTPSMYYVIKGLEGTYYFSQVNVDINHSIVELKLIHTITSVNVVNS